MNTAKIDDSITVLRLAPEVDDLQRLAAAGVKAVVNLRQAGEQGEKLSPRAEAEKAHASGLEYLHYPISPADLTAATAKDFADKLGRLPGPVAIHCASGRRAGLMGLASWAQRTGGDAAKAAERGRQSGLQISEVDLSPLLDASGADGR